MKENQYYKLKEVKYLNIEKSKHEEINRIYQKDGAVAFTLTTIIDGNKTTSKEEELKIPSEKEINIRGKKASVMEEIKLISWAENEINYNIMIENSKVTMEDAEKIVESLVLTN